MPINITEEFVRNCPIHGGEKSGKFLVDIKATVQYDKNLQALAVALNTVGLSELIVRMKS